MSWAALTPTQLLDEGGFSEDEKATLDAAAGTGADLANVITSVIATVRGTIEAAGFTPGAAGTIPDSLRQDVIAAARWAWLVSMPNLPQLQTDARKEANERAQDRFDEIANGERSVEPGVTDEDDIPEGGNWGSETRLNMRTHTDP